MDLEKKQACLLGSPHADYIFRVHLSWKVGSHKFKGGGGKNMGGEEEGVPPLVDRRGGTI